MQLLKRLSKVDAQSILAPLVGGREHADQIEVERVTLEPSTIKGDGEGVVAAGGVLLGDQDDLVLDPFVILGPGLDLDGAEDVAGKSGLERCDELALVATLNPERARVLLSLDVHAPEALVEETAACRVALDGRDDAHGRG